MSGDLQQRLHARLDLAATMLGLQLTPEQLQRLAVELTPAVKALLAEQADAHAATLPVHYAVAAEAPNEEAGVHITSYAGCTTRIGTDVDLNSPAALLAERFRSSQPDVIATDVPTATYVGLTVRPRSLHAWRWWLDTLGIPAESVTLQGSGAYAVGAKDDVAVALRGDGVPELLADTSAARLMGLLAERTPT
ncbi:hypothetical protein ACFVOR_16260 [Streptomyces sp. NPDC057837]|uniref:hypothetical protein n=1 Tax=Streptomyces sp. NPDC057837 TaxID=3346260 RepID=UPI0036AF960C